MTDRINPKSTRVWPGLENAVRAILWDSVAGDSSPVQFWNPQDKEKNVPLVVANGINRLVHVGYYNHGTGQLEPIGPKQVARSALAGCKYSDFSQALLSTSFSEVGTEHGVLVWYDDDYLTKAYAPLDAVYYAVSHVLLNKK